jgi:hypothetical protein
VVFIFGDLNYRVAEGFEIQEVYEVLELSEGCRMGGVNRVLLEQDQLHIERTANRAFQGFQEAPISFKPTYQVCSSRVRCMFPLDNIYACFLTSCS